MSEDKLSKILNRKDKPMDWVKKWADQAPYSQAIQNLKEDDNKSPLSAMMRYDWSQATSENIEDESSISIDIIDLKQKPKSKKPKNIKLPSPVKKHDLASDAETQVAEPQIDDIAPIDTPITEKTSEPPAEIKRKKTVKKSKKPSQTSKKTAKVEASKPKTVKKTRKKTKSAPKRSTSPGVVLDEFTSWLNSLNAVPGRSDQKGHAKSSAKNRTAAKPKQAKKPKTSKDKGQINEMIEGSLKIKGDIATESLAKLYEDQAYYDKAIEVYEKLRLKFPEKSSFFADQIQKLKDKI